MCAERHADGPSEGPGGVVFGPKQIRQARRSSRASAAITVTAGDRHPAGGPTPSGRQTLPLGSHHCPGSQGSGWGPTPSGKQALLNGSQYCPGSHAELTPGIPMVVTAIAAAASMTTPANRPTRLRIADLLERM